MNKEQIAGIMDPVTVQYNPIPFLQARCIDKLGKANGELFFFLWERLMEMETLWGELQVILNSSQTQTDLLQKHIVTFSRIATDSMWQNLITTIVAYGDGSIRQKTSYAGLPELLRAIQEEHAERCREILNAFKEQIQPLVEMRHKHIAHFSRKAISLRSIDRLEQEKVSIGLAAIKTVLVAYSRLRNFAYPQWECGAAEMGGAKSLLAILEMHDKLSHPSE